jgi:PncC family amidohydrolase
MQILLPSAKRIAVQLTATKATLAVAESSAGGLISAALLAVPGASAYFLGGVVVYTRASRQMLLGLSNDDLRSAPPGTEAASMVLARAARARFGATWAIAETGATGPTGSRYGYAAGHAAIALAGPREASLTLETATADREANMRIFAAAALDLLERCVHS